jgi:hypothetical protein
VSFVQELEKKLITQHLAKSSLSPSPAATFNSPNTEYFKLHLSLTILRPSSHKMQLVKVVSLTLYTAPLQTTAPPFSPPPPWFIFCLLDC